MFVDGYRQRSLEFNKITAGKKLTNRELPIFIGLFHRPQIRSFLGNSGLSNECRLLFLKCFEDIGFCLIAWFHHVVVLLEPTLA